MSTFVPSGKDISRKWYVVDASGQTLGRLATKAASVLSGKLNPQYVPYIDMGDHVIVINAEKVRLTGLKSQKKVYRRYTGFPGGLRDSLEADIGETTRVLPQLWAGEADLPSGSGRVEWAAAWLDEGEGFTHSYCNTIPTTQGGTHEAGFRAALV